MNWDLLRALGVHVEPAAGGWRVFYSNRQGERRFVALAVDGRLIQNAPDESRDLADLAEALAPVRPVDVHTLSEVTAQQVYDYVALRLLLQGARSVDGNGECQLRGTANGRKCAVGWLIPDEEYRPGMEFTDPTALVAARWTDFHGDLLLQLANLHDECPEELWPEELARLARVHQLRPFPRPEV